MLTNCTALTITIMNLFILFYQTTLLINFFFSAGLYFIISYVILKSHMKFKSLMDEWRVLITVSLYSKG